ncbi:MULTISPECIES: site-specific DNA-methyltransferase [unclassified Roseitalea]|uniref:site-specific DNA-methyltransferase n=1 Tax=unclassified Roseitalea TaxID=2639107 RepID=UPI00273F2299|nr:MULTISPECIES: site-specific DNA-methyltransferase [unclassified Roseitalea]
MVKSTKDEAPIERVASQSPDLRQELLAGLRVLAPEAFAEGKLDLERLRSLTGGDAEDKPERFSFTWSGRRAAVAMLQAPTRATLCPETAISLNFEAAQHVFVEGENLESLKAIYRAYYGRAKMIYLDPPYNTGNDFIYPDNFVDPLDHYLRITGQKNGNGDYVSSVTETGGRIHSAWLSMMYPRLVMARQLLSEEGVICISISDHEVAALKLLLNEIFGEENFIAQFIWKSRKFPDSRSTTQVSVDHEYLLAYRRSAEGQFRGDERDETKFQNPDDDPRGDWMSRSMLGLATAEQRPNLHFPITDPSTGITYPPAPNRGWRYSKKRMEKMIEEGRVLFPASPEGRPREKKFKKELQNQFMAFPSIIDDVHTSDGTEEVRKIFGFQAFDFPKPTELIRRFVEQLSSDDDLIIDFFAGSCSTAQAVMEQNRRDGGHRRYLCVQLPEPIDPDSEAGRKGFRTISQLGLHRIQAVAKVLGGENESLLADSNGDAANLSVRAFKLAEPSMRRWKGVEAKDADAYAEQLDAFADTLADGWKTENVIWEVALREGYALTSEIEKREEGGPTFWRVTDPEREQTFHICLDDKLTMEAVGKLGLTRESLFICRDKALDDSLAANLALQCRLKVL